MEQLDAEIASIMNGSFVPLKKSEMTGVVSNKFYAFQKFADCPVSFEDQIYLLFLEQDEHALSVEEIQRGLLRKFSTQNVQKPDVLRVRFLHMSRRDGTFSMFLKADDVCPNSFDCRLERVECQRIHAIIEEHACRVEQKKMTDKILSIVLLIYAKHQRREPALRLRHFSIPSEEFIDVWMSIFRSAPVPNMTLQGWQLFVHGYSRYNFDFPMQSDDPVFSLTSSLHLWTTIRDINGRGTGEWCLCIFRCLDIFTKRICRNHLVGNPNMQCAFRPKMLCPHFHINTECAILDRSCRRCNQGFDCMRWHIRNDRVCMQCKDCESKKVIVHTAPFDPSVV